MLRSPVLVPQQDRKCNRKQTGTSYGLRKPEQALTWWWLPHVLLAKCSNGTNYLKRVEQEVKWGWSIYVGDEGNWKETLSGSSIWNWRGVKEGRERKSHNRELKKGSCGKAGPLHLVHRAGRQPVLQWWCSLWRRGKMILFMVLLVLLPLPVGIIFPSVSLAVIPLSATWCLSSWHYLNTLRHESLGAYKTAVNAPIKKPGPSGRTTHAF